MSGTTDPWAAFEPVQAQPDQWAQFETVRQTAGPSGNEALDWARKLGTAGTVALGGVLGLPRGAAQAADWAASGGLSDFGVPNSMANALGAPLRLLQPQGGYSEALGSVKAPGTDQPLFPTIPQAIDMAYNTTGATEYKPATWAGRRTMDALTAAPLAAANPASLPAMLMAGATGGQAAETAGNLGAPTSVQMAAALAGGIPGAKVGSMASNASANLGGIPTPIARNVSATRAELAKTAAEKYGIPVRGAMVEGRTSPARWLDSELNNVPFSNMRGSNEQVQTAFNRAVGKTFGADAPELSPAVFDKAHNDLVGKLQGITPKLRANLDQQLMNDLGGIETSFARLKSQDGRAPIQNAVTDILDIVTANNGSIPGDVYHSMIKRGGQLDRLSGNADPDVRYAARQIKDALEDAVERSLPAGSTSLRDFRDWRREWRSMSIAQDAVDASGNVTGARLNQVARRSTNDYERGGGGDIAELGRIGGALLPEPPQSGTATRTRMMQSVTSPLAAALESTAGRAASSYLRSPMYLNRMIESGLNPNAFRFQSPDLTAQLLMAPMVTERASIPNSPR